MNYVEIADSNSDNLTRFHGILVEAFPDPREREDLEILKGNLREGNWAGGGEVCRYHIIVAGRDGEVAGGVTFYFFGYRNESVSIAIGMGSYLAVKRDFRGNGIGTKLIAMRDQTLLKDAKELGCHLKGVIIQVSDPELMNLREIQRDSMNPWEREKFWRRRGYRKIVFNFVQPPIRDGEPPIEYLSLYMFPHCPEWKSMKRMSRADLQDVVDCFIKCTGTPGPLESDPSYLQMKSELTKHDYFQII